MTQFSNFFQFNETSYIPPEFAVTRPHHYNDNDLSCTVCKEASFTTQWTKCGHKYCVKCMTDVIVEHISLYNQIPKCLYKECNQSLNIQTLQQQHKLQWSYPPKYKIKISLTEYNNMNKLINGYIRQIHIPKAIISLIFDYYYLNYVKPIKCDKCRPYSPIPITIPSHIISYSPFSPFIDHMTISQAIKLKIHDKIDHRDTAGKFIAATIIEKIGTNLRIHYDRWSQKWDIWSDITLELYRFATYKSISTRPAHRLYTLKKGRYIDINPIRKHYGWKYAEIRRIDNKSGQIQVCYEENDTQYLYWMHLDNKLEIAPFASMSKHKEEKQCKCVLALDFNKLCQKQSLCMKCNEYYLNNRIIYWSKCNHILCIKCVISVSKQQLSQHKIPMCPVINCQQEIAQHEYEIRMHNIAFLCDSLQNNHKKSNKYNLNAYFGSVGYDLEDRLKLLLFRKDRFKCSYCSKWHKNINLFMNKITNCNHKYSNECHRILMHKSNCGHSECLKCLSQCEVCHTFDENRCLISWTKCGHKYHRRCAKKYITEWIGRKPSIFGNDDMIPLCLHKKCKELLNVLCAELIGVTQYQCKTLYKIRHESILIADNNDNKFYTKPINKSMLLKLDFASVEPLELEL